MYSDQVPIGLYMFSSGFSVRHSKPKFKDNSMNYILVLVQNMHMVFIIFIWLCLVGRMEKWKRENRKCVFHHVMCVWKRG